jgi:hypothetical protein
MLYSAKYYLSSLFLYLHVKTSTELIREIRGTEQGKELENAYATIVEVQYHQFIDHFST